MAKVAPSTISILRREAGAQRPDSNRVRSLADAANERERNAEKRNTGPSVKRRVRILTADTPGEILQEALLNNTCRCLALDCTGQVPPSIGDKEAAMLASSLRNNRSVLAVTLRGLAITEIGVTSIMESIRRHEAVRSFEIDDIGLTPKSMRSIRDAVRANPGIINVDVRSCNVDDWVELDEIEEAVAMNRLALSDPVVNPFENLLFATSTATELDADGLAWDALSNDSDYEHILQGEADDFELHAGKLAAPVCGHIMHGGCKYGSRCRHFHPERRVVGDEQLRLPVDRTQDSIVSASYSPVPVRLVEAALSNARRRDAVKVASLGCLLLCAGAIGIKIGMMRSR